MREWRVPITDPDAPTAHRLSSIVNELRAILKTIPENRASTATGDLRWRIDDAAKRLKRTQDLCGDIAQTPLSSSAMQWDDV